MGMLIVRRRLVKQPETVAETTQPVRQGPDYSALTRAELVSLAEAKGVKYVSRMNKAQLIEAIEEV